jgi:hypothetical protein
LWEYPEVTMKNFVRNRRLITKERGTGSRGGDRQPAHEGGREGTGTRPSGTDGSGGQGGGKQGGQQGGQQGGKSGGSSGSDKTGSK